MKTKAYCGVSVVDEKAQLRGQRSASTEILQLLTNLSEQSQKIAESLDVKLSPVMMPLTTTEETNNHVQERKYPPLFQDIYDHFLVIKKAFNSMERCIDRTEL